jgi:hypothetical protein
MLPPVLQRLSKIAIYVVFPPRLINISEYHTWTAKYIVIQANGIIQLKNYSAISKQSVAAVSS